MARRRTNRLLTLLITLMAPLALSGCVYYWFWKTGITEEEMGRDKYECQREANAFNVSWTDCMEARGYSVSMFPWRVRGMAQEAALRRGAATPQRTPFERLTEQRRELTRTLLKKIDAGDCLRPRLLSCLEDYERGVRELALRVGYSFVSRDELLFRAAREIARAADDGTITQDQAVNRLLALDAQIDELYRAIQTERARQQR